MWPTKGGARRDAKENLMWWALRGWASLPCSGHLPPAMSAFRCTASQTSWSFSTSFPLVVWLEATSAAHLRFPVLTSGYMTECTCRYSCNRSSQVISSSQWVVEKSFRCWFWTLRVSLYICKAVSLFMMVLVPLPWIPAGGDAEQALQWRWSTGPGKTSLV